MQSALVSVAKIEANPRNELPWMAHCFIISYSGVHETAFVLTAAEWHGGSEFKASLAV